MCGIFGYIGKRDDAPKIVFDGLKRLEYRGYDSWGIATLDQKLNIKDEKLIVEKHIGKLPVVLKPQISNLKSNIAVGHDRWATHGGVTQVNAHPHTDCTGKIAVVHNGIIENFQKLKRDLIQKGHRFKSETDSELFPHLVEEFMSDGLQKAVRRAFLKLQGRNAFVVMDAQSSTMIGLRDGSPLVFGAGEQEFYFSSDVPAFLEHTKNVVFIDDDQGVIVKDNKFELYDFKSGKQLKPKIEKITWSVEQSKKGKYPHFLLKEILEQPLTITASVAQSQEKIGKLARMIQNAFGSYLVACGTASYAALYGTYIFSTIAKKHINWSIGSEFPDYQHFLTNKTLVIAVSQSGETADTLEAVKIAKEKGVKTVAIVNVMGSSLMRSADYSVLTNAGPEIAVVSTKAFTAQLSALLLLAYSTLGKFLEGKNLIERTAKAIEEMLSEKFLRQIQKIAQKLKGKEHIYLIGKGQNYPIALEGALKIKEASYIHGEGFAAGELKHGVIALLEKGTPCIVLFGNDQDRDYVLGSAMEMKARGGYIIGIGPKNNEVFDEFIKTPDISQSSAIINTPCVQLLAYYLAVARGNNPDKPRNLAKSVTVK